MFASQPPTAAAYSDACPINAPTFSWLEEAANFEATSNEFGLVLTAGDIARMVGENSTVMGRINAAGMTVGEYAHALLAATSVMYAMRDRRS